MLDWCETFKFKDISNQRQNRTLCRFHKVFLFRNLKEVSNYLKISHSFMNVDRSIYFPMMFHTFIYQK